MRRNINKYYIFTILALLFIQVVLWMFCTFSQFVFIVLLPALIFCLPTRLSTIWAMIIAFVMGCTVDFLCADPIGLSAVALVPIAGLRKSLVRLIFGSEVLALNDDLSFHRYGIWKFTLISFLSLALFLLVYILFDSAFTRTIVLDVQKFLCSLCISLPFTLYSSKLLCTNIQNRR